MNKEQSVQFAQTLLDSEFANFNHHPADYCASMGWDRNGESTKKAVNKKGQLSPSAEDIQNLASIIESIDSDCTVDIVNSNTVSDFLCNCVATHILS